MFAIFPKYHYTRLVENSSTFLSPPQEYEASPTHRGGMGIHPDPSGPMGTHLDSLVPMGPTQTHWAPWGSIGDSDSVD